MEPESFRDEWLEREIAARVADWLRRFPDADPVKTWQEQRDETLQVLGIGGDE